MQLFNSKVLPILTYGSPIWSIQPNNKITIQLTNTNNQNIKSDIKNIVSNFVTDSNPITYIRKHPHKDIHTVELSNFNNKLKILTQTIQNTNISDLKEKDPGCKSIEQVQTNFIKQILGVKSTTSNFATRYELGIYPVYTYTLVSALKYWARLNKGTPNTLLNDAFICNISNNLRWAEAIMQAQYTTQTHQFHTHAEHTNPNEIKTTARYNIRKTYLNSLNNHILSSKKLTMLCEVKDIKDYKVRPYLNDITDPKHRKTITRLRTASHSLASETGYYYNNKNDPTNFLCKMCNNKEIETVQHFLFECPNLKLSHYKMKIHQHIIKTHTSPLLNGINTNLVFKTLNNALAKLIHNMYTDRTNFTNDL